MTGKDSPPPSNSNSNSDPEEDGIRRLSEKNPMKVWEYLEATEASVGELTDDNDLNQDSDSGGELTNINDNLNQDSVSGSESISDIGSVDSHPSENSHHPITCATSKGIEIQKSLDHSDDKTPCHRNFDEPVNSRIRRISYFDDKYGDQSPHSIETLGIQGQGENNYGYHPTHSFFPNSQPPQPVPKRESYVEDNIFSSDLSCGYVSDKSESTKKTDTNQNIWSSLVEQEDIWETSSFVETEDMLEQRRPPRRTSMGRRTSVGRRTSLLRQSSMGRRGSIGSFMSNASLSKKKPFYRSGPCSDICRTFNTAFFYPSIIISTLLVFALLSTGTILLVIKLTSDEESSRRMEAIDVAEESGTWFSCELDKALFPLYTLSQIVQQLPAFHQLPFAIGSRGEVDSAPPVNGDRAVTHRNMTGILTPELQVKFQEIASDVKEAARMKGVLVSLQLAPQAVVSLVYPLNNTEDFPPGVFLDNTGAVGHDLLNDPERVAMARATMPASGVVIAGPLPLIQGGMPKVNECFIARLAINMPGNVPPYNITVDGVSYESWGFAVALVNWGELKARSHIYEKFRERNLFFRLTRNDEMLDETGTFYQKKVVIAESSNAAGLLDENNGDTVNVSLNTTNNEWVMEVGHVDGFRPRWEKWGMVVVLIGSSIIAFMFMKILVAKKEQEELLFKMLPAKAIKKLRKGETVVEKYDMVTIFFCDIVGFTAMAGEMKPIEVMQMLNELYTELDELVQKHEVYKVETIGDSYMVLGGAPKRLLGPEGAARVASFAIDVIEHVKTFRTSVGDQVFIRAGIASGPVVAGVVGTAMPRYCMFGDTVNLASRMESTSRRMKIQCSRLTASLLRGCPHTAFDLEARREGNRVGVEVKGKGRQNTFWINSAKPRASLGFSIPREISTSRVRPDGRGTEKIGKKLRNIKIDIDEKLHKAPFHINKLVDKKVENEEQI